MGESLFRRTNLGTTQIPAAPPQPVPQSSSTKLSRTLSVARTIFSNDLVKIAAVTIVFSWFLFNYNVWNFVTETDVWWHIRAGEWIVNHHQLPHTDPFSSTGAGKPWVAYSWPFEIVVYEVVKQWDLLGIDAISIFFLITTTLAIFWVVRRFKAPFWFSVGLAMIASMVMPRVVSSRPGPLTIIFFCLVLGILLDAQLHRRFRRLWLVPLIIWAWANVHVQFVYGLFVVGVFCMIPVFDWLLSKVGISPDPETQYLPAKRMWGILAISAALTFVNPYGIGVYKVLWEFINQPRLYKLIAETRSMAFDLKVHFLALAVVLAAAVALGRIRKLRPFWAILLLWAAFSGFKAERDIWLTIVISLCILAQWAAEAMPNAALVEPRVWLGACACVLVILVVSFKRGPTNKDLTAFVAHHLPLGAVAYIHEHHLQGPMFNTFDWGGFLIYALPEIPVVIDGRTNVHGQDQITASLRTWDVLSYEWYNDPLLEQANLVVAPYNSALTYVLRVDPHFKAAFSDGTCVLYQRVSPADKAVDKKEASAK